MDADQRVARSNLELRSPDPAICPFLRAETEGRVEAPTEAPDERNRCIAGDLPEAVQLDWQGTACLAGAHVRCRRYLLGAARAAGAAGGVGAARAAGGARAAGASDAVGAGDVAGTAATPDPTGISGIPIDPPIGNDLSRQPAGATRHGDGEHRSPRILTPAIAVSLVLLVASAAAAVTFVTASGGLQLSGAIPTQSMSPGAAPLESPTPSTPDSTPAPTTVAQPTLGVTSSPASTPTPTLTPTPAQTSDRYALLTPCPSKPSCYLYTVQPGNNLRSIANFFGTPFATVLDLNPQITDPSTIHAGDVIVLPPPSR
ncbi:MAG: LysM peptidoglycan-binding domain-containing protein [Chloroflexi bacterium]|nr:LysM peptidoglycan-binding domain-containing protein [Chloroflexota bacterium]